MKATLYCGDKPNANGVVYPKKVLEEAVTASSELLVVLDSYPPRGDQFRTDLSKAVAKATLSMEGNSLVASFSMLQTPLANVCETLIRDGTAMLMPSGIGMFSEVPDDIATEEIVWEKLKSSSVKYMSSFSVTGLTIVPSTLVDVGPNPEGMFEVK